MKFPRRAAVGLAALATLAPLSGEPVISEFMASNSSTLADGDGNYSDWIELYNPDTTVALLEGWALRDDTNTWRFPAGASIPAGGFLVIFASGQVSENHTDAAGHLHTTFKLDAGGESLALLRPDDSVAFEYAVVPTQHEDVAYGLVTQVESFLNPESAARHWVPDAAPAPNWQDPAYDDSSWTDGMAALGFKTTPGPILSGGSGSHTAYLVEEGTPGNQAYGGSLGMDFEVLEEIRVTDLGVFDDNSDGLNRTITAQLWSRSGDSGIAVLASESFTTADPGTLEGGSRFKALSTPRVLPPGSYTMVASGYGSGEQNGNQGSAALDGLDIDTGEGLIRFVGNSRFGTAGSFPSTVDSGPANRYAAGTFKFSSNSANEIRTNVEPIMWNRNAGVLLARSLRRRRPRRH